MILVKTFRWHKKSNFTIEKSKLIDNIKGKRIGLFPKVILVSDSEVLFIRNIDLQTPKGQNIRKFYTIFNKLSVKVETVSDEILLKFYMSFKYYFIVSIILIGVLNIVVSTQLERINSVIIINLISVLTLFLIGLFSALYYSNKILKIIKEDLIN
jgi:hypothetical protein